MKYRAPRCGVPFLWKMGENTEPESFVLYSVHSFRTKFCIGTQKVLTHNLHNVIIPLYLLKGDTMYLTSSLIVISIISVLLVGRLVEDGFML